jgi:hypothetical protein
MNPIKRIISLHNIINQSGNDYVATICSNILSNTVGLIDKNGQNMQLTSIIDITPNDKYEHVILEISSLLICELDEYNTEAGTNVDGFSCIIKRIGKDTYLFSTKRKVLLKNILNDICVKYEIEPSENNKIKLKSMINSRIESYINRDKRYNVNDTIGYKDFCEILLSNDNSCNYCKNKVYIHFSVTYKDNKMTLDALDPNKGHIKKNIYICCDKCNTIKNDSTDIEFLKMNK